jgi:hypothetical protein
VLLLWTSEVYNTHRGRGDAAVEVPQQRPRVAAAEAARQLRCQESRQRCCCALVARSTKVARQPPKRARRQHRVVVLCRLLAEWVAMSQDASRSWRRRPRVECYITLLSKIYHFRYCRTAAKVARPSSRLWGETGRIWGEMRSAGLLHKSPDPGLRRKILDGENLVTFGISVQDYCTGCQTWDR